MPCRAARTATRADRFRAQRGTISARRTPGVPIVAFGAGWLGKRAPSLRQSAIATARRTCQQGRSRGESSGNAPTQRRLWLTPHRYVARSAPPNARLCAARGRGFVCLRRGVARDDATISRCWTKDDHRRCEGTRLGLGTLAAPFSEGGGGTSPRAALTVITCWFRLHSNIKYRGFLRLA